MLLIDSWRFRRWIALACLTVGLFSATAIAIADDAIWSATERRVLASLSLPTPLKAPPSPSNRYADDPGAAEFGRLIFFDPGFSSNGEVSCASCHQPDRAFADGLRISQGIGTTLRNAPTLIGSAFGDWFYWDGRRDTLWSQALIPLEAPDEMGGSRVDAIRRVGAVEDYRTRYTAVFGEAPPAVDRIAPGSGPFGGKEARAQWHRAPAALRNSVDRAFANLGKAIAAYERTLLPEPTPFDRYVRTLLKRGEGAAAEHVSPDAIAGAKLFLDDRNRCLRCHNGPMFSHGGFHNIGTGNFDGPRLDFGRVFGVRAVKLDPFNCLGPHSDAGPEDCGELRFLNEDAHVPLDGAFKVPSLRSASETAPYFHDGSKPTLRAVIEHYRRPPAATGRPHELEALTLTDREAEQLVRFLESLTPR